MSILDQQADEAFIALERSRRKLASLESLLMSTRLDRETTPLSIASELDVRRVEVKGLLAVAAETVRLRDLHAPTLCTGGR